MKFTGERYVPTEQGEIRLEHYHRYLLALEFVSGKDVIDLGCGEGYGSFILSDLARTVVGIDISQEAVEHASETYRRPNLRFYQNNAANVNLQDASCDVVVSFETIEHLSKQAEMLAEVRRLLRSTGLLIISSPNKMVYSGIIGNKNTFHANELDFNELDRLLRANFAAVTYFGQRIMAGSTIQRLNQSEPLFRAWYDDESCIKPNLSHVGGPVYFIALCANSWSEIPDIRPSIFFPRHYDLIAKYREYATWAQDMDRTLRQLQEQNRQAGEQNQEVERNRAGVLVRTGDLSSAVAERDCRIAELQLELTELRQVTTNLEAERRRITRWAKDLNHALSEKDAQLRQIRSSLSWLAGAPFRRLRSLPRTAGLLIRAASLALSRHGSLRSVLGRTMAIVRQEGLAALRLKAAILIQNSDRTHIHQQIDDHNLYGEIPITDSNWEPKISVIVPNFNHAQYLRRRLDSIYGQTYRNFEVILLDDHSSDGSVQILTEYASKFPERTLCSFNNSNSGSVFKQWKKGFELANGQLIWIAESDDYCTPNQLEELVKHFMNQAVMLAYCRTDFVKGDPPQRVWTSEEYASDLNLTCWNRPFIKSAHWLVNNAWAIKNIVPNVSSTLFRHPGKLAILDNNEWVNLQLCGDWIFYLTIIRGGLVAYSPNATNFYRQHSGSTSLSTQKQDAYYREHEFVAKTLMTLYKLQPKLLERQHAYLYEHWLRSRGDSAIEQFRVLYDVDRAKGQAKNRKSNVVLAAYALAAGGGETFPIMLANLLKDDGYCVMLLNCKQQQTEPGVRKLLRKDIPLLELDRLELVSAVFEDLGVELVHSHHAWVDATLASFLSSAPKIAHVVTMHGMYEMMSAADFKRLFPTLQRSIDRFVYTAEKNLTPFTNSFRQSKNFTRINNALMLNDIQPIPRNELGIRLDSFVLCLVARAIPEKGWEEAINSVILARQHSAKDIHLLLIGEGSECDRLRPKAGPEFIHFLGFRANIRDYFATSDLGFLPSRFPGESFPLVLIDCLHAGRPILASNVGEIAQMLNTDSGLAGELFDLVDWTIPVQKVGKMIARLAEDSDSYQTLLSRVSKAASKFDPTVMLREYDAVYRSVLNH